MRLWEERKEVRVEPRMDLDGELLAQRASAVARPAYGSFDGQAFHPLWINIEPSWSSQRSYWALAARRPHRG